MKKMSTRPIETRIAQFLFNQHLTLATATGNAPAELLLGRRPRSLLDAVRPDLSKTVRQRQMSRDDHVKVRSVEIGDCVFVRNFSQQHPDPKWLFGQIQDIRGPESCTIQLHNQRIIRRPHPPTNIN